MPPTYATVISTLRRWDEFQLCLLKIVSLPELGLRGGERYCCKGCVCVGLAENLFEVLHDTRTARCDDRYGDGLFDRADQFEIVSRVGAVAIDAVEQDLSGTEFFTHLGQRDRIDRTPLAPTL